MGKVFRFHPGGDLSHWQNSAPLNNMAINAIEDPNGLTAKKEITSIPSPFARIDLVRTAFKHVIDSKNLDGNTIFHKMISDSFDIGQILFKSETFEDKISIIAWDKNQDLNKLVNSNNPAHKTLGDTLRLFMEQDGDIYNFNDLQRIYLINYKLGPNPLNIIGGTSPCSLFFSTANKLDYVKMQEGQDVFFDNEFCPLYKRDSEFIKYIFGLSQTIPNFASKFNFVYEYLNLTYSKLSNELKSEIQNCKDWYSNLPNLSYDGIGNIEINGNALKIKKSSPTDILTKSDFVIQSTRETECSPLVLPIDSFNEDLIYTTAKWNYNQKAPFYDKLELKDRKLPFVNDKYPYLTISDLLEPVIIRTLLPINTDFFFDGNHQKQTNNSNKGFLLPIKPALFDYFNLEDLKKKTNDGKPFFELKSLSNESIEAILRIPIKQNKYVTFKRIYNNPINNNVLLEPDEQNNIGAIIENVFTIALFPSVKYPNDVKADYRIAIYEADYLPITEQNKYQIKIYDEQNNIVENVPVTQKRFKNEVEVSNLTYVLNQNFEYLQVINSFGKGIIYPNFKKNRGTDEYTFAIDFGTTNTHIEYSINDGLPKSFEITNDDIQLAKLNDLDDTQLMDKVNSNQLEAIKNFIDQDLIAKQINSFSEASLPVRTSVLYHSNLDFQKAIYTLADINIPFTYEYKPYEDVNKLVTNLKWAGNNDEINKKILKAYFEKVLLLIKAKIILNNGNINQTKIVWFYPNSMSIYKLNLLDRLWNQTVQEIFNQNINPTRICESLAPFYYYLNFKGINAVTKPAVSIDLGGGTTDIVVFENNVATLLTSFRFAGNSIFGDDYNRNYLINGFVQKYYEKYDRILDNNSLIEVKRALSQIYNTTNSNDIINSFFSLNNNKKVTNKGISISFLDDLKEDADFKIIFLLFFSSIFYNLAKLMKSANKEIPGFIIFSGTASKLLQILDSSKNQAINSKLVSAVFNQVYTNDENIQIKVELSEHPKEITAKGGVKMKPEQIVEPNSIKKIYITEDFRSKTYLYQEINKEVISKVEREYLSFLELFFLLNEKIKFKDTFGINPLIFKDVKTFLTTNAKNALLTGLTKKEEEIGNNFMNEEIEEGLFFYPLIGSISELGFNLFNMSNQNENI
jgi:hypothetical protein